MVPSLSRHHWANLVEMTLLTSRSSIPTRWYDPVVSGARKCALSALGPPCRKSSLFSGYCSICAICHTQKTGFAWEGEALFQFVGMKQEVICRLKYQQGLKGVWVQKQDRPKKKPTQTQTLLKPELLKWKIKFGIFLDKAPASLMLFNIHQKALNSETK